MYFLRATNALELQMLNIFCVICTVSQYKRTIAMYCHNFTKTAAMAIIFRTDKLYFSS